MKAVTDTQHYDDIAKSINYTRSDVLYKSDLTRAREEIALDNDYFEDIGEAIVTQDGGTTPEKSQMAARILALPIAKVVANPALILWDWEGTKLAEYSRQDALALSSLPAPSTLPPYSGADHELISFQEWNWSLTNIKTWIQNHEGKTLDVGAIYTTTDGQDHNYWGNPRLDTADTINIQKRGTTSVGNNAFNSCTSLIRVNIPNGVTSIGGSAFRNCYSLIHVNIPNSVTSIGDSAFQGCYSLTQINIPDSVTSIEMGVFYNCYSLTQINIPNSVTSIGGNAFQFCSSLCDVLQESKPTLSNTNAFSGLPTNYRIYVPRADLSWFETATNWSTIYTQGHIVAIEDNIAYLESIGFDVDAYKEA